MPHNRNKRNSELGASWSSSLDGVGRVVAEEHELITGEEEAAFQAD
jgi:hypothetical protein